MKRYNQEYYTALYNAYQPLFNFIEDEEELEYDESRPIEIYNEAELYRFIRAFGYYPEAFEDDPQYFCELIARKTIIDLKEGFYKPSTSQINATLGVLSTSEGDFHLLFKQLLDAEELC